MTAKEIKKMIDKEIKKHKKGSNKAAKVLSIVAISLASIAIILAVVRTIIAACTVRKDKREAECTCEHDKAVCTSEQVEEKSETACTCC